MSRFIAVETSSGDVIVNTQHIASVDVGRGGAQLTFAFQDEDGTPLFLQTTDSLGDVLTAISGELCACGGCVHMKNVRVGLDSKVGKCQRNPPDGKGYPEVCATDDSCGEYQQSFIAAYGD